jgi:hypothetical protein
MIFRRITSFLLLATGIAIAQQNTQDVVCTFADGKGLRVQYDASDNASKHSLKSQKPWTPAEKPFLLFLDTNIQVGTTTIPLGAYGMYVIPGKSQWTLVITKDVSDGAKPNPSQDVARTTMDTGELQQGEANATIYLAHIAPQQCNVRIVYGKTMAWGEIHEK